MAKQPTEARPADAGRVSIEVAVRLTNSSPARLKLAERWGYIPRATATGYPLAEFVMGWNRYLESGEMTLTDAGALIGKSDEWVRRLIAEGVVKRSPNGGVFRDEVVRAYIAWIQDEQRRATKSASESRVKDARAREIELRIALREGELIDLADHDAIVDEMAGIFIAALSSLPARVTRDTPLRRKIEQECDAIRGTIAETARKRASELRAVGDADRADAPNDA
jgi:phage terminase Nu1 subunit (DNA packaging protein)